MSQSKKSRGQLLGEAVCSFANAQTTDEAYFPILATIQKIFDFRPSFIKEIKKVFPTMRDITPPPRSTSEEYGEISSLEKKALFGLREKLRSPLQLSCNRSNQSLVISLPESKVFDFLELSPSEKAPFLRTMKTPSGLELLPIDFSEPLTGDVRFSYPEEPYVATASEVYRAKASILKSGDESVIDDIFNVELDLQESWTRLNTIELHGGIQAQQEAVRKLLDLLIQDRHLGLDSRFYAYLKIYNEMPRSIIVFDQQDSLKERYPILEDDYLRINLPLKWLERIKGDLAYCFIEFLINGDRRQLKRCLYCRHFFKAKRKNRERCYSDDCHKAYEREKKRKQREKDLVKYY